MICQDQVSGYSSNNYRGYETLEEAQQDYHSFLDDEAIDQPVPLAHLPSEALPALQGAPEVRKRRVKDFIIVFLIVVIVRILFF
jgi:t-SNARE complex subunit (syntaxin)